MTTTKIKEMANEMFEASRDAHGRDNMPLSGIAFDFCQQVEHDEPGTYPLFADVTPAVRMAAMRAYAFKAIFRNF